MRDAAPKMYADIQARALAGTGGRSNAIKCMCLACSGWIRADVAGCQITDCPLWHFRPYQGASTPKNRADSDPGSPAPGEGSPEPAEEAV